MVERRDYYHETLARMEPEISAIDASTGYASIAISLKRIADAMEASNRLEALKQAGVAQVQYNTLAKPMQGGTWKTED